jgi:hypothetical protein
MHTHQKALSINLDPAVFGSFAEIGAGQEVARWFFRVGGASGTVAKTISAYDKEISDDLYGAGTRYVSRPRLEAMLESEWKQLLTQLQNTRSSNTCFFSFVDTVAALNYTRTNECHGWMGVRFLQKPCGPANEIVLHINLKDPSNLQQQEAVGILGVNLIYAAVHISCASEFLLTIFEELRLERLEIDLVDVRGPAFETWDKRALHISLVSNGLGEAVAFSASKELLPPSELLHNKAVVLAPKAPDSTPEENVELVERTLSGLQQEELGQSKEILGLSCVTCAAGQDHQHFSTEVIVKNVEDLQQLGKGVLVFRQRELYKMSAFINRFTKSLIYFAIELSQLVRALHDNYEDLPGNLLEGIATLLQQNVRLIVHPIVAEEMERCLKDCNETGWLWRERNRIVGADDLHPEEPLDHLYQYLLGSKFIVPVRMARASAQGSILV